MRDDFEVIVSGIDAFAECAMEMERKAVVMEVNV